MKIFRTFLQSLAISFAVIIVIFIVSISHVFSADAEYTYVPYDALGAVSETIEEMHGFAAHPNWCDTLEVLVTTDHPGTVYSSDLTWLTAVALKSGSFLYVKCSELSLR